MLLDFGYGDAVTPGMEEAPFSVVLDDLPAPRLRLVPRATVAAEKLEAIVHLGMANTRLKDYFDLRALANEGQVAAPLLGQAVAATFRRRGTPIPTETPLGLSDEFAKDSGKQKQWLAFLRKNRLDAPPLRDVVAEIRKFAQNAFRLARDEK